MISREMFVFGTKEVEKVWGLEYWLTNRELYCGKVLEIKQGMQCSLHYHALKQEDFSVISGKIRIELQRWDTGNNVPEGKMIIFDVNPRETVHIPRYTLHRFTGLEECNMMIEISTQHFDEDSYRLTTSGAV